MSNRRDGLEIGPAVATGINPFRERTGQLAAGGQMQTLERRRSQAWACKTHAPLCIHCRPLQLHGVCLVAGRFLPVWPVLPIASCAVLLTPQVYQVSIR